MEKTWFEEEGISFFDRTTNRMKKVDRYSRFRGGGVGVSGGGREEDGMDKRKGRIESIAREHTRQTRNVIFSFVKALRSMVGSGSQMR